MRIITKKYTVDSAIQYGPYCIPRNRYYGLWSSQIPPASVRVKALIIGLIISRFDITLKYIQKRKKTLDFGVSKTK